MSSTSKLKIEIHSYLGNSWQLKKTKICTKTWMIFSDIRLREKKQTQKSTQLMIHTEEFLEQMKIIR